MHNKITTYDPGEFFIRRLDRTLAYATPLELLFLQACEQDTSILRIHRVSPVNKPSAQGSYYPLSPIFEVQRSERSNLVLLLDSNSEKTYIAEGIAAYQKRLSASEWGLEVWKHEPSGNQVVPVLLTPKQVPVLEVTGYSNRLWALDYYLLPTWTREFAHGQWAVLKAYLMIAMDVHSRSIAGLVLSSVLPDANTTASVLHQAIRSKDNPIWENEGLPEIVRWGGRFDLVSNSLKAVLTGMGVVTQDGPLYPNQKGITERFFRHVDVDCLRHLPGHVDAVGKHPTISNEFIASLLTTDQLLRKVTNWVVDEYHETLSVQLGRTPARIWSETVSLRFPKTKDVLNSLLIRNGSDGNADGAAKERIAARGRAYGKLVKKRAGE